MGWLVLEQDFKQLGWVKGSPWPLALLETQLLLLTPSATWSFQSLMKEVWSWRPPAAAWSGWSREETHHGSSSHSICDQQWGGWIRTGCCSVSSLTCSWAFEALHALLGTRETTILWDLFLLWIKSSHCNKPCRDLCLSAVGQKSQQQSARESDNSKICSKTRP